MNARIVSFQLKFFLTIYCTPLFSQYCDDLKQQGINPIAKEENVLFGDDFEDSCWKTYNCNSNHRSGMCPCWETKRCKKDISEFCGDNELIPVWCQTQLQNDSSAFIVQDIGMRGNSCLKLFWKYYQPEKYNGNPETIENSDKKVHFFGPGIGSDDKYFPGVERWYSWSAFFPSDGMRKDNEPCILFQIHGRKDEIIESWRRPILRLNVKAGNLSIGWSFDENKTSTQKIIDDNYTIQQINIEWKNLLDKWIDFVCYIKYDYSEANNGIIELWIGSVKVFEAKNIRIGYNDKVGPYPGWGMYWYLGRAQYDHWYYLDNIRIGVERNYLDSILVK